MGAAQNHLSAARLANIARGILAGVNDRRCLSHGTGDQVGAYCPFPEHPEKTPGGAFLYDPDRDLGRCYGCGNATDIIGLYNLTQGRDENDPEGFKEFMTKHAPGAKLSRPKGRRRVDTPAPSWLARTSEDPPKKWMREAEQVVLRCALALRQDAAALDRLAAWGIPPEAAKAFRLGWCHKQQFFKVTSWGLPYAENENGNEKCVWIPQGLVIPNIVSGKVVGIKVRQENPPKPEDKYRNTYGGSVRYFVYGRETFRVWMIIETERDAAMVAWLVNPLGIGVMGTGSASNRPDAQAGAILARSDLILNCLDNDRAGALNSWDVETDKPWKFSWEGQYPQAVRWMVPTQYGKDPGDMVGKYDVLRWVVTGLPDHVRRKVLAKAS